MKINWGTGLVIGMLAFISFIMYFVVTMMTSKDFDHDMVVEDYYKEELHYQQDIDAEKNALALEDKVKYSRNGNSLFLTFPSDIKLSGLKGNLSMYRPSNKMLDFKIPLEDLKNHKLEIPNDKLVDGRWNVIVSWNYGGKEYLYKKEIIY
ncbi:MAG: FixH family protein [Christiangramia sp.]